MIEPFEIRLTDERLCRIREQVAAFEWDDLADAGGWQSGVGIADLRRLVDHWLGGYDWRAQEAKLNRRSHYKADVEGIPLGARPVS